MANWIHRVNEFLRRPLLLDEASRVSRAVDCEIRDPGGSGDPILGAIARTAAPKRLADEASDRSWAALERDLFGAGVETALPAAGRIRFLVDPFVALLYRVPRAAFVGAVLLSVLGGVAVWRGPTLMARSLVNQSSVAWARIHNGIGGVQFVSRVAPWKMQWSGTESFEPPDRMRLQMDALGATARIIIRGDAGTVDAPAAGPAARLLSEVRFMARALRLDSLIHDLDSASSLRYEGTADVAGAPCRVIAFSLPVRSWTGDSLANLLPRTAHRCRVWLAEDTHLPLQVEFYGPDRSVALTYRFTAIRYNTTLPEGVFDAAPILRHARSSARRAGIHMQTLPFRISAPG